MKTLTDDQLQLHFMFEIKDDEIKACFRSMDSVENLNSNPIEIRRAGYNASRRAFLLGVRYAEEQAKANVTALENLSKAFDSWYGESGHMCDLSDKVRHGTASHDEVKELGLLNSLLNASINVSRFKPEPEVVD